MTRILFVGQRPDTVDYSDPALPPGFDAEKIEAGIAVALEKIAERGWTGETCMITPDDEGLAALSLALRDSRYACVVIGGGLRIPPKGLPFFEAVVNIVHRPSCVAGSRNRLQHKARGYGRGSRSSGWPKLGPARFGRERGESTTE